MIRGWLALITLGLGVLVWGEVPAHEVPNAPKIRLLNAEVVPDDPLSRRLILQVRDPAGREPVAGAEVTVRAFHETLGSGLRIEPIRLTPTDDPGIYRGGIRFPRAGRWELTIDVVGRFVGDAHIKLDVSGQRVSGPGAPREKPELVFDFVTVRHLAMEWGHLGGFALWLAATMVGLVDPARRGIVLVGTWAAFAIEGVTGFYKMEYSTPFATPLRLFSLERVPRVFFANDYASTLVFKHVLMVIAMAISLILTVHAWRRKPGEGHRVRRDLLLVNLILALTIAAAATMLGFYHAIVLHFS